MTITGGAWLSFLRATGVRGTLREAIDRTIGGKPPAWFSRHRGSFVGTRALEIGGPSWVFGSKGYAPVYPLVGRLDIVDFSNSVVWHQPFLGVNWGSPQPARTGERFLGEATDLRFLADGTYDVVVGSHVLEHLANPIRGLIEWKRVTRPGGVLLVLVPERERSFDHRRPVTPISHLISDYIQGVGEDDLSHLPEILALHDLHLDPWALSREDFERRSRENYRYRGLHQHVFDVATLEAVCGYAGFRVVERGTMSSLIGVLLEKP